VARPAGRAAASALLAGLLGAACAPEWTVGLQYARGEFREVTTEIRWFAFDPAANPEIRCEALDPKGRRFGDAEQRTGWTAAHKAVGTLEDEIAVIRDLPARRWTIVAESWDRRPLAGRDRAVLNGFACADVDIGDRERAGVTLTLRPPDVGPLWVMEVPETLATEPIARLDAAAPLLLTEGVTSDTPFLIRLLDRQAQSVAGMPVSFRVVSGGGRLSVDGRSFASELTVTTGEDGAARAFLRAERSATRQDGGRITVEAYAAGFESSPTAFSALVVPAYEADVEVLDLPVDVDLDDASFVLRPILAADLDDDGLGDVVTASGDREHRLVFLWGTRDGGYTVERSPPRPGAVFDLALARLDPGAPPVLVASVGRIGSTAEAGLELWRRDAGRPAPDAWRVERIDDDRPAPFVTARDLDGDGVDELALTRCGRLYDDCWDISFRSPTSEIAIRRRTSDGRLETVKTLTAPPQRGGFRRVSFVDLDADGALDLVSTTAQWVQFYCGIRGAADFGFDQGDFQNITLGQGWSIGVGQFDADSLPDVVSIGAFRAEAPRVGLRLTPGCIGCRAGLPCGLDDGPPAALLGIRGSGYEQDLAVADLNGDGHDDVLNLHRVEARLHAYLGLGDGRFAPGPSIGLPVRSTAQLAVVVDAAGVLALTTSPEDGRLVRTRLRPAR
jgi:hypothetical protein